MVWDDMEDDCFIYFTFHRAQGNKWFSKREILEDSMQLKSCNEFCKSAHWHIAIFKTKSNWNKCLFSSYAFGVNISKWL